MTRDTATGVDLIAALEQAATEARRERVAAPDLPAALAAERQALLKARDVLDDQLAGLERGWRELAAAGIVPSDSAPTATRVRSRAGLQQKVAQHHLDAISEHLESERRARQADIAKALGLNSGVVSRAMRELDSAGRARQVGRDGGSVVWELTE